MLILVSRGNLWFTKWVDKTSSGVRYQDFYFDIISIRYWGKYRNFDTIFDNFLLCGWCNCVGGRYL